MREQRRHHKQHNKSLKQTPKLESGKSGMQSENRATIYLNSAALLNSMLGVNKQGNSQAVRGMSLSRKGYCIRGQSMRVSLILIAFVVSSTSMAAAQGALARVSYNDKVDIARYTNMGLKTVDPALLEYFRQPIRGTPISIDNTVVYHSVQEIARLFRLRVNPADIRDDLAVYEGLSLIGEDTKVSVMKSDENEFKITMIEYVKNCKLYDWKIKIGDSKADILKRLPHPNAYDEKALIYVDKPLMEDVFRQLNIYFDQSAKVIKVQFVAWQFL